MITYLSKRKIPRKANKPNYVVSRTGDIYIVKRLLIGLNVEVLLGGRYKAAHDQWSGTSYTNSYSRVVHMTMDTEEEAKYVAEQIVGIRKNTEAYFFKLKMIANEVR